MYYKIYQFNKDKCSILYPEKKNVEAYMFLGMDQLIKKLGKIDMRVYDCVYEGCINGNLEQLFYKFNMERPSDYKGWWMSVGHIVEITENIYPYETDVGFYYCDTIGFKKFNPDQENSADLSNEDNLNEFVGQLIDIVEDEIERVLRKRGYVYISGVNYDEISTKIKETLKNWEVIK